MTLSIIIFVLIPNIQKTLDGFVFALHRDGKIMYISETASVHLGLPQIDLTGSSIFEYIHPADRNDMITMLALSDSEFSQLLESSQSQSSASTNNSEIIELGRSFCIRMKCILPKRNAGLVCNGYKAIHCSGYLKVRSKFDNTNTTQSGRNVISGKFNSSLDSNQMNNIKQETWESFALVAVGYSLLPTASTEVRLDASTFMFRANLDLKLYYIEAG